MSELYHHGILGQRKGVRNGPPYPLNPEDHSKKELKANPGLRRQADQAKAAAKSERKSEARYAKFIKVSRKSSRQSDYAKLEKVAKSMTDDELKKANSRLALENTYMSLMKQNSPVREKRMKWARDAINTALKTVGTQLATVAISKAANAAVSKILGQETEWVNPMTGREPQAKKQDQPNNNGGQIQKAVNKASEDVKNAKKQVKEMKKEPSKPAKETEKTQNQQTQKKTETTVQTPKDHVPDSFKLEPKVSSDGTITWAMPQGSKKKKKK